MTLGDILIENARKIIELKQFKQTECCPVCGARLQSGEKFCSSRCELIFYDERGEK